MRTLETIPTLDPWLLDNLVCPLDGKPLIWDETRGALVSSKGRVYPVVDGVPVMIPEGIAPTLTQMEGSREAVPGGAPWYLDSVFLSAAEKKGILRLAARGGGIDPVAAYLVAATNGIGYAHLVGELTEYPIPEIRLPPGNGRSLLDVGCSWGRWCVAASRNGYQPIGIDPSLGAVMTARRVTRELGVWARFVVGDARYLPFKAGAIDTAFSYSVIQHFSVEDAHRAFEQIGRVLGPTGTAMIQMPTKFGLRCLYNQARRGWRETRGFEVRYWHIGHLLQSIRKRIGPAEACVDCFFGIGWQPSDVHLMPPLYRRVVAFSEALRRLSLAIPALTWLADSVYVKAQKAPTVIPPR